MADMRDRFVGDVRQVAAQHREASARLVKRLKGLTPAEFLREPPGSFDRLTAQQYRDIVAAIAPEVSLPEMVEAEDPPASTAWGRLKSWWSGRAAFTRAIMVSVAVAVIGVPLTVLSAPRVEWLLVPYTLKLPRDVSQWPMCGRLAWTVDGCDYVTPVPLSWSWVADRTGMSEAALMSLNQHLPPDLIPAGSHIIIWRSRGQLVGGSSW